MLIRLTGALAALCLACVPALVRAQDDDSGDGLRQPERLTVGAASSDQFAGQLAPDGKRVYLVSNRSIANEVMALDPASGSMRRVFDEGAETTWPRVSPSGRRLLYVSFRDRAHGQLCVRDLPEATRRRCLDIPGEAVQAEWMGDTAIALVGRPSVDSDLRLFRVALDEEAGTLVASALLDRNLASPAVSPDGRWLVYVPVERYSPRVGSGFAASAGARLEVVRLDRPGTVVPLSLDLPGLSGQPAFSQDGRFLYFTQFLDDTNRDALIDGSDNGVLFRVPFEPGRDDAVTLASQAFPEQLTDGRRNCQYPMPSATDLVVTCARRQGLDVFKLPLDGMVPRDWTTARLWDEVLQAGRREDQLLFYRHLLGRETVIRQRRRSLVRLVLLHLELDQFAAAELYAGHLTALADPTNPGMGRPLAYLVAHRKSRLGRDRAGSTFVAEARRRFGELAEQPGEQRAARGLGHLVRSEIADDLGDKDLARAELAAVDTKEQTSSAVFHVYSLRVDALFRSLDDREALVASLRSLAEHATLEQEDRLDYARAAVRALVRGRSDDEADRALADAAVGVAPETELGFALALGRAVLAIRDAEPGKAVREALVQLYKQQVRQDRRRAVVLDAVGRANALDAERVVEALSALYLKDVPPGAVERRAAVRLYQRATEGRAYRRLAAGRVDRAIALFWECFEATGSHESLVEWLTLRLQKGASPRELLAELDQRPAGGSARGWRAVAQAFLVAQELPGLEGEAHAQAAEQALSALKASWAELRKDRVALALQAQVHHQIFLRTGNAASAQRASSSYQVALDRSKASPRLQALLLGQLGLLQEQVGNWRIALTHLDDREKFPYLDDAPSVAARLSRARVLLHAEKEGRAAEAAAATLAAVEASPKLSGYRLLALDRAALYHLAAGRFEKAVELYDREVPQLEQATGPSAERNRVAVRLARAAALMGAQAPARALADLTELDGRLQRPEVRAALRWPHATPEQVLRTYRLIAAGLRVRAMEALGQPTGASLEERRRLLQEQLAETRRDEDAHSLSLVEAQLALVARETQDRERAERWARASLATEQELAARTGVAADRHLLLSLWLGAELSAGRMSPELAQQVRAAHEATVARRDPALRSFQRWLEAYLAIDESAPSGKAH